MDKLQSISLFVRVADTGSFTRAAESLRMPRSSVSGAIRQLEEALRTRLIHRTTRRMQLTQDGAAYLDWCRRLLDDIEETESRLRRGDSQPRGTLRVDMPSRIGRRLVAPALPAFFRRYPELELELGTSDRAVDLVGGAVDCAVRVGELRAPQLVARRLGLLPQVNCASPAYLAERGMPASPQELAERHLLVHYTASAGGRADGFEYRADGQTRSVAVRGAVAVDNAEAYVACCLAGLGIIQVPAFDVAEHLDDGSLMAVLPAWEAPPLPLSLVYPHRRPPLRVRVFASWIEGLFARHLEPGGASPLE